MALENAARSLGQSIANETVETVAIKYGGEAATLTKNSLYAAGHTAMTAYNISVRVIFAGE
jgi:hypothetical protein